MLSILKPKPNNFLFLFSNKMLVFRVGIHKMPVKIENREDPDQTDSSSFPLHNIRGILQNGGGGGGGGKSRIPHLPD